MPTAAPKKIVAKFYKDLREFTAWPQWDTRPGHTNDDTHFIPVDGVFVSQFDYPAQLKKLMDHGWRSASKPTTAPMARPGLTIGRAAAAPAGGGPALGRPGLAGASSGPLLRTAFAGDSARLLADWDHISKFRQVAAYTFRGDRRAPEDIRSANGFQPPSSRIDAPFVTAMSKQFANFYSKKQNLNLDPAARSQLAQEIEQYVNTNLQPANRKLLVEYHFWREVLENQQMHLSGMSNDSFLKAYISSSRDPSVGWAGSGGALAGSAAGSAAAGYGFLYVLRINPGFLLETGVGGISKREAEISHLGPVLWQDVMGFVSTGDPSTIYLRNEFDQKDFNGFKLVLGSMSDPFGNTPQGW